MPALKRICIIQPILTDYCLPVFLELSRHCHVDIIFSPVVTKDGFSEVAPVNNSRVRYFVVPTFKPLGEKLGIVQYGVENYLLRERPDAIFTFANPRYCTFWTTLLLGKILDIPTYVHGHGLYKKHRLSLAYRGMMNVLLRLITSYICYAPVVHQSFIDHGFPDHKLTVAHNSLINEYPVLPSEKIGKERGILFVGRLRQGSRLDLLVRVMERIRRSDGIPLCLHVIGDGEEARLLQAEANSRPWIVQHGQIFDQEKIRQISLNCFVGCYPGNAGLSVVHMMSLSLPVITHDNISSHQGPEPSFIRDGISGFLYDHRHPEESLYQAIKTLASDSQQLLRMRRSAFEEYQRLVTPPLSERFWAILNNGQDVPKQDSLAAMCTSHTDSSH